MNATKAPEGALETIAAGKRDHCQISRSPLRLGGELLPLSDLELYAEAFASLAASGADGLSADELLKILAIVLGRINMSVHALRGAA